MSRLFRDVLFKLVVSFVAAGIVATIAFLNKIWSWPNALVGGFLLASSITYLMDRFGPGPSVKSRVRDWLDSSGFSIRTIQDTFEFHFVMTDGIGYNTDIFPVKPHSPVMIVSGKHEATKAQIAAFRSLTPADQLKFWKNVRLELLRYGIEFSKLMLESPGTNFSDTFVVSRTSTGTEFLKRVLFVRSGARLYRELLEDLVGSAEPGKEMAAVVAGSAPPLPSSGTALNGDHPLPTTALESSDR